MPATAPRQKPGRSRQDYRTPVPFLEAVQLRLGVTVRYVSSVDEAVRL